MKFYRSALSVVAVSTMTLQEGAGFAAEGFSLSSHCCVSWEFGGGLEGVTNMHCKEKLGLTLDNSSVL